MVFKTLNYCNYMRDFRQSRGKKDINQVWYNGQMVVGTWYLVPVLELLLLDVFQLNYSAGKFIGYN